MIHRGKRASCVTNLALATLGVCVLGASCGGDGSSDADASAADDAAAVDAPGIDAAHPDGGSPFVDALAVAVAGDRAYLAEDLAWIGDHLGVSRASGFVGFDVGEGRPALVASENTARRGASATLRLCSGVGAAGDDLVMTGDLSYLDVYRLLHASEGTQPDINATAQRLRLDPGGETIDVTLSNNGQGELTVSGVTSTAGAFSVDSSVATLSTSRATS